jgi:predicted CopG family antitoxin
MEIDVMATKTITIDTEAYSRLKSVQKPDESFSQTIKRVVRRPVSANALAAQLGKLSDEFWDAVAAQEASRRATRNRRGR